jgi:hypothetical protein
MHTGDVGNLVIAVYTPHQGKEAALLQVVKEHLPILRGQKLATDFPPLILRSANGTILEIFEWVSEEAVRAAHTNAVVLELWKRFDQVCVCDKLASLPEAQAMFPHFERIEL